MSESDESSDAAAPANDLARDLEEPSLVTATAGQEVGLDRRRAALVVAAGLVPWAIIPYETGAAIVFSFGQVTSTPLVVQPVTRYLLQGGPLPQPLLTWPMATFLYLLGVVSAALALVGQEDRRVTAGLFALAGLDLLYFALAFSSVRLRLVAIPVGVVVLWLTAWVSRPRGRRF